MLRYGKRSLQKLSECDIRLQQIFMFAISLELVDISIIEGIRPKEKQNEYFVNGKSKLQWPDGKHNVIEINDKSKAVDAAPYINGKVSWEKDHCIFLAGIVLSCAKILNIKIRWGGNWDCDLEPITDQKFYDLVHFELVD